MRHRLVLILTCIVLLASVSLAMAQEARSSVPQELLDAAVDNLQSAESFKLAIKQTGEPYPLALSFDGVNLLPATLTGAEAQYVSPNELHISALLQLFIPCRWTFIRWMTGNGLASRAARPGFYCPPLKTLISTAC